MMTVATAYSYSVLCYCAAVWLGPFLNCLQWNRLKSISAQVIMSALRLFGWQISYKDLHEIANRALPKQMMNYTTLVAMKKILDNKRPASISDYVEQNSITNSRTDIRYVKSKIINKYSTNTYVKRVNSSLKLIENNWLLEEQNTFKRRCKRALLR